MSRVPAAGAGGTGAAQAGELEEMVFEPMKKHTAAASFGGAKRKIGPEPAECDVGSYLTSYSSFKTGGGVGWAAPHEARSSPSRRASMSGSAGTSRRGSISSAADDASALAAELHEGMSPAALQAAEKALARRDSLQMAKERRCAQEEARHQALAEKIAAKQAAMQQNKTKGL